jgi:hypothetical protein
MNETPTNPALSPEEAIKTLDALEDRLHTIARLGRAAWLAARALEVGEDDRNAVAEIGEQIERLAHEAEAQREAAYAALRLAAA